MEKIFLFGAGGGDIIYFCSITDVNQSVYEWQEFKIKMPLLNWRYHIVLSYRRVVIICYYGGPIYCIDLWNGKIYKSHKQAPNCVGSQVFKNYMIECNDNTVHYLYECVDYANFHHTLKRLGHVIPKQMERNTFDDALVMGYTRFI
eukprot:204055_1